MMAKVYDYHSYTVNSINGASTPVKLVAGNQNRVVLVISSGEARAGAILRISFGPSGLRGFLQASPPYTITLLYRDYGPLVTEEFWVEMDNVASPSNVVGTEVVIVPK